MNAFATRVPRCEQMAQVRFDAEYVLSGIHFYLRVADPVRGLFALLLPVRAGAEAAGVRVVLVVPEVRTRVVVVLSEARVPDDCCSPVVRRVVDDCRVVVVVRLVVDGCCVVVVERAGCCVVVVRLPVDELLRVVVDELLRVAVVERDAPDCSIAWLSWRALVTRVAVWLPAGMYVAVVRREND